MPPAADAAFLERAGALYGPVLLCLLAGLLRRRTPFRFTAVLLSVLWVAPALLLLQLADLRWAWWSFPPGSPLLLCGMPLELLAGWAVLWGVLPTAALPHGIWHRLLLLLAADALLMPRCTAVVTLHRTWWIGEVVAVITVLLPSLCIATWTEERTHVRARAALQVATAALVFLFALPELLFALHPGGGARHAAGSTGITNGWSPLVHLPAGELQLVLEAVLLFALPGISAAQEFAERGNGTPLPFDPPRRLVTSGIYRYCANPMQLGCTLTLLLWAAVLRAPLFALAAPLTVAYSAGLALWDERTDLRARFGEPWQQYRCRVPAWRLRWRPYHVGPPAVLYLAATCGPCSAVSHWIEQRSPVGLQLLPAETAPAPALRRMRYDPRDGTPPVDGVRAMARALEHLHLGYAACGFLLRLPGVWPLAQLALDVSGLGPRTLQTPSAQTHSTAGQLPL